MSAQGWSSSRFLVVVTLFLGSFLVAHQLVHLSPSKLFERVFDPTTGISSSVIYSTPPWDQLLIFEGNPWTKASPNEYTYPA